MINKVIKIILLLFATMIILVAAGHGAAPIFFFQLFSLLRIPDDSNIYLFPVLFFCVGQVFLFLYMFLVSNRLTNVLYYGGLSLILFGVVSLLLIEIEDSRSYGITLFSMIPFFFLVVIFELNKWIKMI
jgi:hypothetical protein